MNNQNDHKQVPYAEEAEAGLLGAILFEPDCIEHCIDQSVRPSDFYIPAHRSVYEAIIKLYATGRPFDMLLVTDQLRKDERLEVMGGEVFLHRLIDRCCTPANAKDYAQTVAEKGRLRRILTCGHRILEMATSADADSCTVMGEAQTILLDAGDSMESERDMCDVINDVIGKWEEARHGKRSGLPCFMPRIDRMTNGFKRGKCYYVGAEPGGGKSIFLTNQLEHWAIDCKIPSAMASIEMDADEVVGRILAKRRKMSTHYLDAGRQRVKGDADPIDLLYHEGETLVDGETGDLKVPLYINDKAMDVDELAMWARMMVRKHGIQALVVDYLQILRAPASFKGSSYERAVYVVQRLTRLAKELHIVILIASQLTLTARREKDKRPRAADMRGCGNIEDDAYGIIMLYMRDGVTWADVQKNRGGQTGRLEVAFLKHEQRWRDEDAESADNWEPNG